jgi:hypothetical protein
MELLADAMPDEAPDATLIRPSIRAAAGSGEPTWQFLKQGYDWTGGSLLTKGYRTDFDAVRIPSSQAPAPNQPADPEKRLDWRHPDHLRVVAELVSSLTQPTPSSPAQALQVELPQPVETPHRSGRRLLAWAAAAMGVLALASFSLLERDHRKMEASPMAITSPPAPVPASQGPSGVPQSTASATPIETTLPVETTPEIVATSDSASRPSVAVVRGRIELEVSEILVSSRAVAAVVILKRTGSTEGPVRVRWKTVPGTATPGIDYESVSAVVKFADGQVTRTLFVPILQPPERTEPRSFSIQLQRLSKGPALGSIKSTAITIWGDT